jgi:hypothetical protein
VRGWGRGGAGASSVGDGAARGPGAGRVRRGFREGQRRALCAGVSAWRRLGEERKGEERGGLDGAHPSVRGGEGSGGLGLNGPVWPHLGLGFLFFFLFYLNKYLFK